MLSLSKRAACPQWQNQQRQATLRVPELRAHEPRQSAATWLHPSRTRTDFTRLRRTLFFARLNPNLRRGAKHCQHVAQRKKELMPELSETLIIPPDERPTLEFDELWSFVLKRANKRWIWIALCRQTRQVELLLLVTAPHRLVASYGRRFP